ncbi:MAG: hypothetical protein K2R93_02935 [Gemmatimonadaceae bacterium]|nr:hypothetical protein [Gemmatimonadaceae bacterium]
MDSLFPNSVADSLAKFTEQREGATSRFADAVISQLGPEALSDMTLPYVTKHEAEIRAEFPSDSPMLFMLDHYREQVRMELRHPIPGID